MHSIPNSGGNFPKDVTLSLFPSLSNTQVHKHTHAWAYTHTQTCTHTLSTCMHAYLCALFIFVLSKHPAVSHLFLFLVSQWWKAPAVLSRNPSLPYVTDTLPALFTRQVVIQSPLEESQLLWHGLKGNAGQPSGSIPSCDLSRRGNRAIMWMTFLPLHVHLVECNNYSPPAVWDNPF